MSVLIQAASVIFFRAIYVSNREVIFIIPYHADYIPLVLNSHLRFISIRLSSYPWETNDGFYGAINCYDNKNSVFS